jgi:hypothetical protein
LGEPRIRLGTKVESNSRIQFASNQSKLVPRKLYPGPSSKVGLSNHLHFITTSLFPLSTNMDMEKKIKMCLFMSMKCILIYLKLDIDINNDELLKAI